MADKTPIEWTDATWNPIVGCSVVSPGCTNCYAMRLAGTRMKSHPSRVGLTRDSKAGPVWTGEVRLMEPWLTQPLRWSKPRMIFVCAHADLFHEAVPDDWIDRVFAVMALAPQHTFQVLTKRPERMRKYLTLPVQGAWAGRACQETDDGRLVDLTDARMRVHSALCDLLPKTPAAQLNLASEIQEQHGDGFMPRWPLPNVWLGVSVEDQRRADERIPILLDTPAAVRWISAEPLLGPIDPTRICIVPKVAGSPRAGIHIDALRGRYVESRMPYIGSWDADGPYPAGALPRRLDWVVAGGESGPGARPANPQWFRDLRDQCAAAGVPYLHKQNGEWVSVSEVAGDGPHHRFADGRTVRRIGKKAAGRLLDGVIHDGYPEARPHG